MEALLPAAGQELLSTGLIGAACIFLLWLLGRKEQELKDTRHAAELKLAEKDKLIQELQESRLEELKLVVEHVNSNTTALQASKATGDSLLPVLNRILDILNARGHHD